MTTSTVSSVHSRPSDDSGDGSVLFRSILLGVALLVLMAGTAVPSSAQFRDVAYTFEPTVQGVFNADNASFQEEPLYGGLLGLGFGRYFQVGAEYLVNTGIRTDLMDVDRLEGLPNRDLDVRRYGARMRVNLYDRRIIPYLTVGSGVLRLKPAAREATRTIYGLAGGGIAFTLRDWFRMSVSGELLSYRYDPVATYLGPTGAAGSELGSQLVTQPAVTTSISLFLGGRSPDEQTAVDQALQQQFGGRGALGGVRLFVNPFYGRLEFNDALGFPKDPNLAGVTAGVDLGPYIGLRGFYWRGTEGTTVTDDFGGGFEDIQMYGSELQFRLNLGLGQGFVPYARIGGGYMDVLSGYADDIPEGTTPPEDRFFGIGGGGLEVPISRSFKLSGGVRGLVMDNPNQEEAGDPGDLYGSLMYTAGIEFRLGGGRDEPQQPEPQPRPQPVGETEKPAAEEAQATAAAEQPPAQPAAEEPAPSPTPAATPAEAPAEERLSPFEAQLLARLDSLESSLRAVQQRQAAADTAAQPAVQTAAQSPAPEQAAAPRSNVSERTMTLPVPEDGEVYLRFGEGPAPVRVQGDTATVARPQPSATRETVTPEKETVTPEEVEQRLQQALRQQLAEQAQTDSAEALRRADLERIIQEALSDVRRQQQKQPAVRPQPTPQPPTGAQTQQIRRLEEEIEDLRRELREQRAAMDRTEGGTPDADPDPTMAATPQPAFYSQIFGRPLTYIVPMPGFRAGVGPSQFQIGVRGDYRLTTQSKFRFVPELSFGIGQGEVSPTILFNAAYSFLRDTTPRLTNLPLEPYVGFGLGIASRGGFTFEPVTNTMLGVDYQFRTGQTAFLEYSALDFLNTHRVHLGYRVRF